MLKRSTVRKDTGGIRQSTIAMASGTVFEDTRPKLSEEVVDKFIKDEIEKSNVAFFGKTTCPGSIKVKKILDNLNQKYNDIELDEIYADLAAVIEDRLLIMTGKTPPIVFFNGEYLGCLEDIEALDNSGILEEIFYGKLNKYVEFQYDVLVIGGGSAGLSVALNSAKNGFKVCVVDYVKPSAKGTKWGLGGTCTNVGCIPKILIHKAASLQANINDAPFYGWTFPEGDVTHDWETLINAVQNQIGALEWNLRKHLIINGIILFDGLASFIDRHTILVTYPDNNNKEDILTAKYVVVAVGCRPRYLEFPGAEECITSDDIFSSTKNPEKTLIIGGSYIALEIASFLNALHIDVTVVVRSDILSSILFDKDMVDNLEREMSREGVKFIRKCNVIKIEKLGENSYNVTYLLDETDKNTDEFNTIILAVGRVPSTDGLCFENVGIKLCSNCKIPVNDREQTIVKNIYAIGDCANGRPELSSSAVGSGRLLAKRIKNRDCNCVMDYRCIPTCVFSTPEYACCGLSENAAIRLHGQDPVKVYVSTTTPIEQAIAEPAAKCSAKLITIKDVNNVERLAGFHLVCNKASEIIQGFALALRLGASKKDLDCFTGIHPTCAEIFTNLSLKGEETAQDC